MTEIAISAEGLGKRYYLGQHESYGRRLTEVLTNTIRAPFRRSGSHDTEFWALRDVSFEVPVGAALGVIGRNGAGKSTLLKILSRITWPDAGSATLNGRIASLLEVGTGFHPELSGTENIFLSGSVLGMRRAEIQRNFDEIVEFSGIDTMFLDTPVKRYSSGMQVRLGFAVAAHLESEILLVDEVLAVGDMEFQKRCLGKMNEVTTSGRTILFVSHQLPMIASLCDHCLLLDHGQLIASGIDIGRHLPVPGRPGRQCSERRLRTRGSCPGRRGAQPPLGLGREQCGRARIRALPDGPSPDLREVPGARASQGHRRSPAST